QRPRVGAAGKKPRIEQARDVAHVDRPVREPAPVHLDLDERLEPIEPARAVADDLDIGAAPRRLFADRRRYSICTDRACGRIGWDEDSRLLARHALSPVARPTARASRARARPRRSSRPASTRSYRGNTRARG